MTPQEQQWVKDLATTLARHNLDEQSAIHVILDVLADVLSRLDSRDKTAVLSELAQKVKAQQEKALLTMETLDPGVAAAMDKHHT
jgi:hypothetical protein